MAGRNVSEPATATATTAIVQVANETNVRLPARNMPAIAMITVRPETSTALPDVDAAATTASSGPLPASRSSISRRR